jgi:hypothetical protein
VTGTKDYDLIGRVIKFAAPPVAAEIPPPAKDFFPILASR